jgi:TLC domain
MDHQQAGVPKHAPEHVRGHGAQAPARVAHEVRSRIAFTYPWRPALTILTKTSITSACRPLIAHLLHACRLGHIVHALVATSLVAATLASSPDFPLALYPPPGAPFVLHATTPLSVATMYFSFGYFLADIVLMNQTVRQPAMVGHHIGGVVALLATMASGTCHFYGLLLLSTEATTTFICFRWHAAACVTCI